MVAVALLSILSEDFSDLITKVQIGSKAHHIGKPFPDIP